MAYLGALKTLFLTLKRIGRRPFWQVERKEKMMNNKRTNIKEKGITLVALVVTVIVILILAGVTISLALGDNGIIGKAQEASNMYANASKDEKKSLNDLSDEISRLSKRGEDGEGGSGGGESQTGTPTGMKNAANNETIYKTESATGTVTPLSTTGTTTVKDNKENEIKVPKNFGIAYDSGDNVADGIVIEDTSHNQYVWIPVGTITNSSGASKTIDLIRSNFNGTTASTGETIIDYFYEYASNPTGGKTYNNTKAKNLSEFISSANGNHGYYLARYEAGIDADKDQYNYAGCSGAGTSMTYGDSSKMKVKDGTVKPLSKQGAGVWNAVTQSEAATICRSMYTKSSDGVESDLINSFAWDTTIYYIQKCGIASNSSSYAGTQGKSEIDTSTPQTTGTNKLLETGKVDEQCKIFDMAGNCYEWSTETLDYNNFCNGYRGSFYNGTNTTKERNKNLSASNEKYCFKIVSFRPILYM